ncbi:S-layer homology domain-containing protein [Paenibacillus chartarius]|uniref:S-layer homology domain-containing protein n=1 Tax=Paenibacillus chartarius TaxID=747481 RepID=A0ABV6DLE9_9BACL
MIFTKFKVMKNRLAAILAMALLSTSVMPNGAVAADTAAMAIDGSSAVTETVYSPDDGIAAPKPPQLPQLPQLPVQPQVPAISKFAVSPLSWNLLGKLNRSFMSMVYATADTPITKLSADERYLAFMTYKPEDEHGSGQKIVMVQDRQTGQYLRIRTPDREGSVIRYDMTPDARYFAYTYGENTISGRTKVYWYDLQSDELVTVNGISSTNEWRSGDGEYVSISADGRFVAFDTEANGLVANDVNGERDVYLYDRQAAGNKLERISVPKEQTWNNDSWAPSLSADGSRIAFVSKAKLTDLEDYIGTESVYLLDRHASDPAKALQRVTQGTGPSLSSDGLKLAFTSYRDDLVSGDTNNSKDIFVYHTNENMFRRVSMQTDGSEHTGDSDHASISRNGAYVAYELETNSSRDETEVYVADSEGLTSSKVDVPGTPYPLLKPSKNPTVSDTGNTVTFYSFYTENIAGVELTLFDYFIATNGTAPEWPAGSELTASGIGTDTLTLSWPQAVDPDGVTGYAIYRNGEPAAYVPASAGRSYTFTGLAREPDADDVFQVDAIDSRYHMSLKGPTYTWENGGGENPPPTELPLNLIWTRESGPQRGPLVQGAKINLIATGDPNRAAAVEVSYKARGGGTVQEFTESVPLMQTAGVPGLYKGSFQLTADTTELSKLKLTLTGGGKVQEKTADDLPVAVGGALKLTFSGASPAELQGAILTLLHPTEGEVPLTLAEALRGPVEGLWPSDDYEIVLHTSDYMYEIGRLEGVRVESGRVAEATVPVSLPARVRVKVLNEEGKPVPDVPVTLWDEYRQQLHMASTGEDGMTDSRDGLLRDQTITAEVDLSKMYYELAAAGPLSLKLGAGDNVLTVHVIAPDRGNLELTVKNPAGEPVYNAYVTATETYKGITNVVKGRTSLDGKVRFEHLVAGDVVLEAAEYSYYYSSGPITAAVQPRTTTLLDIPVKQPDRGVINLRVFKKALDTEWQGPLNMENENFLSVIQSRFGWVRTYYSNAVTLGGSPGTPVQVCVSGAIYAYVSSCKEVIMDDQSNATAEIRLEETGARVQGRVEVSRSSYYSASVYELLPSGGKRWIDSVWDDSFQSDPFQVNVPRGGSYRMQITRSSRDQDYKWRYEYATVDFTIAQNQIKNIGTIAFSPTSYFANQSGNSFSAESTQALPGSTIGLRAVYSNDTGKTAADAALLLDIPEGMTIVADSQGRLAVSGGKPGAAVEGGTLRVPLGDVADGEQGAVSYKLRIDPSFNKNNVMATARIQASLDSQSVEELLGTIHLDAPRITLDAPARVSDPGMQTVVSGYAPAGSTVHIYDTEVKIGTATASMSGQWKAPVTLNDLGSSSLHALWATANVNNVELRSNKTYLQYDSNGPQLVEMAFSQAPAGRWISVKTGQEAPNIVYTVVPGNPFQFDFKFTNPDMVENVRMYMDGQEGEPVPAERQGDLFRAVVPTTHDALGGIYVDYDVKRPERTYDGSLPNLDQLRASLPPKMRDFEVVSVTPFQLTGGKYAGAVQIRFPQLNNARMSVTLTVDPESSYKPSAEEQAAAQRSGVPAVQTAYEMAETEKSMSVTMKGYMPRSYIVPEKLASLDMRTAAFASGGSWGDTAEYFMEIKTEVDGVNDSISEVKDQFEGYQEYAEKINKIMYNVESGLDCLDEMPTTAKEAGKALAAVVLGEVAKTAMNAGVAAMALTGPGAAVAGVATSIIEDKIDNYVDEQIDAVGSGYNECNDNPDKRKKKGRKLLSPKWIYDPSGYVYEAVKSNPLEDVTATVEVLDERTGTWQSWNAGEYDQGNPQQTDKAGKYGWDVPPGKWRVQWKKAGYETLYSAELDVPPPHTEVNAGLVSRDAPVIDTVTGVTYEGGSYVDIVLSKYVKVVPLSEAAVAVTDAGNTAVPGTASFIGAEASASDPAVMLSRTIRFVPKTPLVKDARYWLTMDRSYFTSYANTALSAEALTPREFHVTELDQAGPVAEEAWVENGGRTIRIRFNEPIGLTFDAGKVQLAGSSASIVSAVTATVYSQTDTREAVLALNVPLTLSGTETLSLQGGVVPDLAGNGSAERTLTLQDKSSALLSGLTFGQGSLSPRFGAYITTYKLELPSGTKQLGVTATAANSGAQLTIGAESVKSGETKSVTIPQDGIIRIQVQQEGRKETTYTIQVTYSGPSSDPSDPSDPSTPGAPGNNAGGGSAGSTKDPLNLGDGARMEKRSTASGGMALLIEIEKSAVEAALKDGKKQQKLYVDIKEPADELVVQLPAGAVKQLAAAQARLLLQTAWMGVEVDASMLRMDEIADGAIVRLTAAKAGASLTQAASEAARLQNESLRLLTDVVTVTAEAHSEGKSVKLSFAAQPGYQGQLSGKSTFGQPEVYRYDEAAAKWTYVRSKKSADGKQLLFDMEPEAPYSVMSLERRFADTAGHWAEQDIDAMARRLLVNGVTPQEFRPEATVTRAEFAAMLVRALGLPVPAGGADTAAAFTDVDSGAWYREAVIAAASHGLATGLADGRFGPDDTITREQMAVMIGRAHEALKLKSTGSTASVLDAYTDGGSVQGWAQEQVVLALQEGYMQGMTADTFAPQGVTTRAQAVIVLGRLLRKQEQ